jgi:hypothetical protein
MPARPCIYHITHVDNLPSIIQDGGLWSDAKIIERGGSSASISMGKIKERRLKLQVKCHAGDFVGNYVPFYFCPRSVMLYVIHCGNHPELGYRNGQGPIVHFEADLHAVVKWAESTGVRWAFSLSNASAYYTEFRNRWDQLTEVDWTGVAATDFRNPDVKEGKQAEFLVREVFPWHLVQRIGVQSTAVQTRALRTVANAVHRPAVEVRPDWYF